MEKCQRIEFRRQFGRRLKTLREQKRLSQTAVATVLGCTAQNVYGIERGKWGTDASNLPALAELFGVTVGEILEGEPEHAA
jgi:transcriptional regulator with XRE-family HTH domain